MHLLIHNLLRDETGATAIEYGLIAALISVAAIATLATLGTNLNNKFVSVANGLN
jgi:pilus assembly protein Flp/PilA